MDSSFMSPVRDSTMGGFRSPCSLPFSPYGRAGETPGPISGTTGRPLVAGMMFASPLCNRLMGSPPPYSPGYVSGSPEVGSPAGAGDSTKRGRPKANMITSLIIKGYATESASIRCGTCNRVFPRDKSLQAHMRTHTGERPYQCDYPGCEKAFCQSGQLKTHQRLHSGEKPFVCSADNCRIRFTHANRHCADHPASVLVRDEEHMPLPSPDDCASPAVQSWLIRYAQQREVRTPNKPRAALSQPATKRSLYRDLENQYQAAKRQCGGGSSTPPSRPRANQGLDDSGLDVVSPITRPWMSAADAAELSDEADAAEDLSLKTVTAATMNPPSFSTPLKPSGYAVSVIRRAGFSLFPGGGEPTMSPMKAVVKAEEYDFKMVAEGLAMRGVAVSPMKSPRKQAALALIQLSEWD